MLVKGGSYMQRIYAFNEGSYALHIYGCCKNSKHRDYRRFNSESEAFAHAGRQIFLCAECEQKRDQILEQALEQREKEEIQ